MDPESGREYYKGYLYAITDGTLSEDDRKRIETMAGGIVIGEQSGAVNSIQIKTGEESLHGADILAEILMNDPAILYAGCEMPIRLENNEITDESPWSESGEPISNKYVYPHAGNDWWAEAVNMYETWSYFDSLEGYHPVKVGVIDSGFQVDHPDFENRFAMNAVYSGNTGGRHGTSVAGLIGAAHNQLGGRGAASEIADITLVDYTSLPDGVSQTSQLLGALNQLIAEDTRVINISQGLSLCSEETWNKKKAENSDFSSAKTYNEYLRERDETAEETSRLAYAALYSALMQGYDQVLIVESAGNGLDNASDMPGSDTQYSGLFARKPDPEFMEELTDDNSAMEEQIDDAIMIVTSFDNSVDEYGRFLLSEYASYGQSIDLAAPGTDLFTTKDESGFDAQFGGTSGSAPIVSGAAALLWSIDPDLKAGEVKELLANQTSRSAFNPVNPDEWDEYPALDVWASISALLERIGLSNPRALPIPYYGLQNNDFHISFDGEKGILECTDFKKQERTTYDFGAYSPGRTDYYIEDENGAKMHLRYLSITPDVLQIMLETDQEKLLWCDGAFAVFDLEKPNPQGDGIAVEDDDAASEQQVSKPETKPDKEEWKQAYISHIEQMGPNYDSFGDSTMTYKLVDIDGDAIPELYMNYGSTAAGEEICAYTKNGFVTQHMYDCGFSYIEGANLFRDNGGHMDGYYDKIYRLENGRFVLVSEGQYGAVDNSNVQYDENGFPIYQYFWQQEQVGSEAEYKGLLHSIFDETRAHYPLAEGEYRDGRYRGNGLQDYDGIIAEIEAY